MDIKELDRLTELRRAMTPGNWIPIYGDTESNPDNEDAPLQVDGAWIDKWFEHDLEDGDGRSILRNEDAAGISALVNAFDSLVELARLGLLAKEYVDALDEWHKSKSDEHAANADYTMERYLEAARRLEVKP